MGSLDNAVDMSRLTILLVLLLTLPCPVISMEEERRTVLQDTSGTTGDRTVSDTSADDQHKKILLYCHPYSHKTSHWKHRLHLQSNTIDLCMTSYNALYNIYNTPK